MSTLKYMRTHCFDIVEGVRFIRPLDDDNRLAKRPAFVSFSFQFSGQTGLMSQQIYLRSYNSSSENTKGTTLESTSQDKTCVMSETRYV